MNNELDGLIKSVMSGSEIVLGNVRFFVDADGPWAGQLSYDTPLASWDKQAIFNDLSALILNKTSEFARS